jgi:hypothetical protein
MKHLADNLELEVKEALQNPSMVLYTFPELKTTIESLGYTLEFDFNYTNTLNSRSYKVVSYRIKYKGVSFSNVNCKASQKMLQALQEIRTSAVCVHNNRMVEL